MALRFTVDDLDGLKPNIRRQLAPVLEEATDRPANCQPQKKRLVNRPEEEAGKMLVTWIDLLAMPDGLRPGLFFYHVPNGGARSAAEAGLFKAQGVRKGWPDYCLDLPLGRYHGLRLELKAEEGDKPNSDQLAILVRLESVGFKCCVAWGFDDAKRQIEEYLDLAN